MGKTKCTIRAIKRKIRELLRKNGLEHEIEDVDVSYCSVSLPSSLLDIEDIEKLITKCGYYFAYFIPYSGIYYVTYEKRHPFCYEPPTL